MKIEGNRFLITGGAGLMGSHISDRLLAKGASETILLDNFVRGSMHNIENALKDKRVRLVKGDIRDLDLLMDLAAEVDGMFHMAALRITACADNPRDAMEVMLTGTMNVLQTAVEKKVGKAGVKVDATTTISTESKSQIALTPSTTSVDLVKTYQLAGDFLGYDTQVKVGFSPDIPDHYMAGISLRLNGTTGDHLGVSFQKPDFHFAHTGAQDRIPDDLVPTAMEDQFGIVLWRYIHDRR